MSNITSPARMSRLAFGFRTGCIALPPALPKTGVAGNFKASLLGRKPPSNPSYQQDPAPRTWLIACSYQLRSQTDLLGHALRPAVVSINNSNCENRSFDDNVKSHTPTSSVA